MNKKGEILLPNFLQANFEFKNFKTMNINNLYVGLFSSRFNKIVYKSIFYTPHFFYAKKFISRKITPELPEFIEYMSYIRFDKRSCIGKFDNLIDSIISKGYKYREKPILVFKSIRRPFPINRYYVADGFHRLAILAALNKKNIDIAVLKNKFDLIEKLKKIISYN